MLGGIIPRVWALLLLTIEHRLRQKDKCELSPYFQDRLEAENSDYVPNLNVTVNVMHGGWWQYQVSIFLYLQPGQWLGFFSFSSFLPAFTFLLQLLSFWLQVPWHGIEVIDGESVKLMQLEYGNPAVTLGDQWYTVYGKQVVKGSLKDYPVMRGFTSTWTMCFRSFILCFLDCYT